MSLAKYLSKMYIILSKIVNEIKVNIIKIFMRWFILAFDRLISYRISPKTVEGLIPHAKSMKSPHLDIQPAFQLHNKQIRYDIKPFLFKNSRINL